MDRALIVGGGIAGTATAMALHKAGLDVTVYEAYPSGGDDAGAFLTVGANGMAALAQIEATAPVAEAGFPLTSLELSDANGKRIGTRPLAGLGGAVPAYHHLRRSDLYRVLQAEAAARGIPIEHGRRLTAVEIGSAGGPPVRASFADGGSVTGDLLIGADGLRSTVRNLIDPAAAPPRYTGQRVFYGYAPEASPPPGQEVLHMIRGRKAAFGYTVSPGGETWWFVRVPGAELSPAERARTTPAEWRSLLVPLFRRDRTPAADIIAATGEALLADNVHDLPGVTAWHRGPMLIVGDAAHAASPASGQGASMALEDAIMLAKSLRDLPDRARAFTAYERLRRSRVDRVIDGGARLSRPKTPNLIERAIRDRRARRRYARPAPAARDWMLDYPLDWDTRITLQEADRTAVERPAP
jgi:2-polyprenyl-6-methoxyphenol hydroxylase-like FAD-dependent oxidoreductase